MSNSWRIGVAWVTLVAIQVVVGIELDVTSTGVPSLVDRAFYDPTRMNSSSCFG